MELLLGHGIVGGKLVPGKEQGRAVAGMAVALMKGNPSPTCRALSKVPTASPSTTVKLARLNISESLLPEEAEINFRPPGISETHPKLLTAAAALLAILAALILKACTGGATANCRKRLNAS